MRKKKSTLIYFLDKAPYRLYLYLNNNLTDNTDEHRGDTAIHKDQRHLQ